MLSQSIDGHAVILTCPYKTVGQLANSQRNANFITAAKATT